MHRTYAALAGFGIDADAIDSLVLTGELTREQMQGELRHVVTELQRAGVLTCEVEFGFAWNLADDEKVSAVALVEVEAMVKDQEHLGAGVFGEDDVRLRMDGIEVLFCHDSDIHVLCKDERYRLVIGWADRWSALGYSRSFWRRDPKTGGMQRAVPDVGSGFRPST